MLGSLDYANPFWDFHQPSILMRYIGLMKRGEIALENWSAKLISLS
jgi:hypothetical protein